MKQSKNKEIAKGFTLVELLVVISIIGLLSSFAVVSLNSARQKARDALRKGDMAQIRTAMNLYYDDKTSYPVCGYTLGEAWDNTPPHRAILDQNSADCYFTTLGTALTGGTRPYLGSIPKDPRNLNNQIATDPTLIYRYASNGREYAIAYRLEEDSTVDAIVRGW